MSNKRDTGNGDHAAIVGTISYLARISAPITRIVADDNQESIRFAFVIAYDGSYFHGLAKDPQQPNTIQQHVETKLANMVGGSKRERPCNIVINGRTDAGVHSNGTVFHFEMTIDEVLKFGSRLKNSTKKHLDASFSLQDAIQATAQMFQTTNRLGLIRRDGCLQQHIQILQVVPVSPNFHARKSCVGKQYCYKIHEGWPLPLEARSCWSMNGRKLNVPAMQMVAQECLLGIHDCSIFVRDKRGRSDFRSPIRHIQKIEIVLVCNQQQQPQPQDHTAPTPYDNEFDNPENNFGRITIYIQADFFLKNMCRRIVGLLVQVGLGKVTPEEVKAHLFTNQEAFKNDKFLVTAPAKGLCLNFVLYNAHGEGGDPTLPARSDNEETTTTTTG